MYAEKALDLFKNGCNCSQAVVLAFKDILPVDEETLKKVSFPFGGGLGRLRLTCGAASGLAIVLGLLIESTDKAYVYEVTRTLLEKVEAVNGSLICKDLLESKNIICYNIRCSII